MKNRTVSQALAGSMTAASDSWSPAGPRKREGHHPGKKTRLYCKWHPQMTNHSTANCRRPGPGSSTARIAPAATGHSAFTPRRHSPPGMNANGKRPFQGKDKSQVQCFKCKKFGHYANECTNPPVGNVTVNGQQRPGGFPPAANGGPPSSSTSAGGQPIRAFGGKPIVRAVRPSTKNGARTVKHQQTGSPVAPPNTASH